MNNRVSARLLLAALAVALLVGASRSAAALPSDITPQAYLPNIQKAAAANPAQDAAWSLRGNRDTAHRLTFWGRQMERH